MDNHTFLGVRNSGVRRSGPVPDCSDGLLDPAVLQGQAGRGTPGMAQGQGQGVRGVVGPGDGFQVQQAAGHVHHLALFRLAVAHHRHLHLGGGVLVERDPALFRRVQQHAAGVGHGDAGGQVRVEEQLLDGDDIRLQLADQVLHIGADLVQPPGERQPRRGGEGCRLSTFLQAF